MKSNRLLVKCGIALCPFLFVVSCNFSTGRTIGQGANATPSPILIAESSQETTGVPTLDRTPGRQIGDTNGSDATVDNLPPDVKVSPPYGIYVGGNIKGVCGYDSNSGGFKSLTFDTSFLGIRFVSPSKTGLPGPYGGILRGNHFPIGLPGMGLLGEGKLGDFTLCPMYETETDALESKVTSGPKPFQPSLGVSPATTDPDQAGCVRSTSGDPMLPGGGDVRIVFSIGAAADMSPILTWETDLGKGALGGSVEPVQAAFCLTWDQLMSGKEFETITVGGDEGESWEWRILFYPESLMPTKMPTKK